LGCACRSGSVVTTFMDVDLAALLMVGIALSYILLRAFWI
jgi:hypothetical protein